MSLRTLGGLLCVLFLCPAAGLASGTGAIVGTVADPSGAVVIGARVVARNLETNARRDTETGASGEFSIPLLPPGTYEVSAEARGFRRAVQGSVRLDVNQSARVDFVLAVGELAQQIVVDSEIPRLQTQSSTLGQVVDREEIDRLPLNERTFLTFTLLAPGAQLNADGSQNSIQGGAISVNGAREQSNNFLLDGVDNNDLTINQYAVLPSVDAIREFKVQSANSSAEFGRSGGAQINVVLRGGTNTLHGTLYEFFRNRHLDAKNVLDQPDCTAASLMGTCSSIPRYDRNQFGGTVGGPLARDRAFFFVSYEALRLGQATTREATVPSQVQRAAALAAVPAPARNPAGEAVLNLLPAANAGADLATSNRFVAAPVIRQTVHLPLVKLDWLVGPKDTLASHYALYDDDRFNPFDPLQPFTNLPGFGSLWHNRGQIIGVAWTRVWSPRLTNEFRFGFNRRRATLLQENSGTNQSQQLGFPEVKTTPVDLGFPGVAIAGFDGIGESRVLPQGRRDNTFQWSNVSAWNPPFQGGRHQLKFGADIRRFHLNGFLDALARGQWFFLGVFTGDPLQDLLLGLPAFALAGVGDTDAAIRTTQLDFFAQDNLRVHHRLTLNLGLRYEYNRPPVDTRDRLSTPDLSANSLTCTPKPDCQFLLAGTSGVPRATFDSDLNNFAPRIGLAWQPFAARPFVVRAAYGIFFDATILNVNLLPRLNPPFFETQLFLNFGTSNIQTILMQPAVPLPPVGVRINPDFRDAYLQHWNANVQYELRGILWELAYVGSKGTHLVLTRNPNQALPGTGAFPFPQFGPIDEFSSAASSSYHSLQLRVEKRFQQGLAFLGGYNWSRSIDNSSAIFSTSAEPGFAQDSFNLRAERGLSNFHAAHRFVGSLVYELPFGRGRRWLNHSGVAQSILGNWDVSGIIVLQSGRPFTVNRGIDQSLSGTAGLGIFADRPNQIADPFRAGPVAANPDPLCQATVSSGGRAADQVRTAQTWFNPCAFADPGVAFGNAPRNSLIGPTLKNVDLSVARNVRLAGERRFLQFRADFFNISNHPNFDLPDRIFDSQTFAQLRSANGTGNKPPRQVQLAMRFGF